MLQIAATDKVLIPRIKADPELTQDDLVGMLRDVMTAVGSCDLVMLLSAVRDGNWDDNTTPSKVVKTICDLYPAMKIFLQVCPNTRMPKKKLETSLVALNAVQGTRWCFEHRRLVDVATDVGGGIRLLLSKLREISKDKDVYRRAAAVVLSAADIAKLDDLISIVNNDAPMARSNEQVVHALVDVQMQDMPSLFSEVLDGNFDFAKYMQQKRALETRSPSNGSLSRAGSSEALTPALRKQRSPLALMDNPPPVVVTPVVTPVVQPLTFALMDLSADQKKTGSLVEQTIEAGAKLGGGVSSKKIRCVLRRLKKCLSQMSLPVR